MAGEGAETLTSCSLTARLVEDIPKVGLAGLHRAVNTLFCSFAITFTHVELNISSFMNPWAHFTMLTFARGKSVNCTYKIIKKYTEG